MDGVWCGSLPNCGCLCPSSNGTVVEIIGNHKWKSMDLVFCDDGEIGDANGRGVICLDGSAWLRPTHLDESLTEGDHFLGCGLESA
jgi:hypothetical protein